MWSRGQYEQLGLLRFSSRVRAVARLRIQAHKPPGWTWENLGAQIDRDGGDLRADHIPSQARLSSFVGALALGDLVKSTLGPKGMNKILHSTSTGEITVTNDGATILKSIALDNPAAKILVNISKVQDDEVGDGEFGSSRLV